MYPEFMIAPMRQELTQLGVRELRTAAEVDESIRDTQGTLMIVVNSVCGCAAGKARPGVAIALQHAREARCGGNRVRRRRRGGYRAGARLLHRISAFLPLDRAPARRETDVH